MNSWNLFPLPMVNFSTSLFKHSIAPIPATRVPHLQPNLLSLMYRKLLKCFRDALSLRAGVLVHDAVVYEAFRHPIVEDVTEPGPG